MTFSAMDIGRTGVGFAHNWLNLISHNLANANTATGPGQEPFRSLHPVARPLGGSPFAATGSGIVTAGHLRRDGEPPRTFDPTHPLADEEGLVTQAHVDVGSQLVDLMMAQRSYQANIRTVQAAKEAYESALRLGGQ